MYPTRPLFIFSKTARTPHHIFNPGATRNLYGFRLPIVTHIPFTYYQHFLFFAQYTLSSIHNGNTGYSTVIVRNGTGTCPCPTPKGSSTKKNLADTIERKRAVQVSFPLLQLTSANKVSPVSVLRLLRVAARRLQNQLLRKGLFSHKTGNEERLRAGDPKEFAAATPTNKLAGSERSDLRRIRKGLK